MASPGSAFPVRPVIATLAAAGSALALTGSAAPALVAGALGALLAVIADALASRGHRVSRALARLILGCLYRVRAEGLEHVPGHGPALLVCNHVSYLDALVLIAMCPRPVRFLMDHRIHDLPLVNRLFRAARTIPVAPAREDRARLEGALDAVAGALSAGEGVCLFPEGGITSSGEMTPFRRGVERILERSPVPVVPMALRGLWGTWFSRHRGAPGCPASRRRGDPLTLVAGPALDPAGVTAADLQRRVAVLRGDER